MTNKKLAANTLLAAAVGFTCHYLSAFTMPVFAAPSTNSDSKSSTQVSKEPIRIGFVTSLSGLGSNDGPLMVNGFKLFLEQHNNTMAGRPVDLNVCDDKGAVNTAVSTCKKLVEKDKVDVVSGFIFAPLVYACAPLMNKEKVPFNVTLSGADDISQRKREKWVFRTGFTSCQVAQPLGEYAAKKLGYKKIVTIASDYSHPHEAVGAFQKVFEENGGQVVQRIWLPMDQPDYREILKKVSPDADAVFLCLAAKAARIVPGQLKESGNKHPLLATSITFEGTLLPTIGKDVLGGISTEPYSSTLDTAANKSFVSAYKQKYGSVPGFYAESGYTSAAWINKAAEMLKGDLSDKEKFLSTLKTVQLPDDPRGPLKLDSYGTVLQNIYVRKVEKVDGVYQNTVIHTYPAVSQFWKAKPEEFFAASCLQQRLSSKQSLRKITAPD